MGSPRHLIQVSTLLVLGSQALNASAQVAVSASTSGPGPGTSDASEENELGDTPDALPGLYRIGIVGLKAPRATAALHGHYGYTEAQNGGSSGHHRMMGSLAAGFAPWSFLGIGVRADFRHDIHGDDALGSDTGSVLDLTPLLRAGVMLDSGLHLGAEARLRMPGATGGDAGPSPELDGRALVAYSGLTDWVFGFYGGYRLGHRGAIVDESANMRPGDRVALGLSEFDAILLGLGAERTFGSTEVFAEVTSDMLIGGGAPGFAESPFRVDVGLRHPLIRHLWLSAIVEASPLSRAPSIPGDPLVPIEPRVQGTLGIIYRFLAPKPPKVEETPDVKEEPKEEKPEEKPPEKQGPPPVIRSSVQVTVVDQTGHPISDAKVRVEVPKAEGHEAADLEVPLESRNIYMLDGIPVGDVSIVVTADLLKPHTESVRIVEGQPVQVEVKLLPSATLGSQLRGLVRSYSGEGITASVTVEPGGHTAKCDSSGVFELDLPPAVYTVIIEAEGYRSQRRSLRVRKEGVTVLNADLQQAAP